MVRLVVILTALTLLGAACEPDNGVVGPTPGSAVPTHVEAENFNDVVLTGGSRSAEAGFSGTYTLRATVDGTAIAGAVSWHRKDTRVRADFNGTVDGQTTEMNVITGPGYPAEDMLYVCTSDRQICAEAHRTVDGDYPAELLPSLVALRLLDVATFATGLNFYDESARTLVEQPALCFVGRSETSPAGAIDHGEVCLTVEGRPLLVTASGSGRTVLLTATKLPGSASDGDFELPYAIQGQ